MTPHYIQKTKTRHQTSLHTQSRDKTAYLRQSVALCPAASLAGQLPQVLARAGKGQVQAGGVRKPLIKLPDTVSRLCHLPVEHVQPEIVPDHELSSGQSHHVRGLPGEHHHQEEQLPSS